MYIYIYIYIYIYTVSYKIHVHVVCDSRHEGIGCKTDENRKSKLYFQAKHFVDLQWACASEKEQKVYQVELVAYSVLKTKK